MVDVSTMGNTATMLYLYTYEARVFWNHSPYIDSVRLAKLRAKERQRITAAKRRARIVTAGHGVKGSRGSKR